MKIRSGEAQVPMPANKDEDSPLKQHGSLTMKQYLMRRFFSRGGGFVSTKDEGTLLDLGLVKPDSHRAARLAGEFCGRYFMKMTRKSQEVSNSPWYPAIYCCMDASRVAGKEDRDYRELNAQARTHV